MEMLERISLILLQQTDVGNLPENSSTGVLQEAPVEFPPDTFLGVPSEARGSHPRNLYIFEGFPSRIPPIFYPRFLQGFFFSRDPSCESPLYSSRDCCQWPLKIHSLFQQ